MHFYFFDIWKSELSLWFRHLLKMEKYSLTFPSGVSFIFQDWLLGILAPALSHSDPPVCKKNICTQVQVLLHQWFGLCFHSKWSSTCQTRGKLGLSGVLAPGAQSKSYLLGCFHRDLAGIGISPRADAAQEEGREGEEEGSGRDLHGYLAHLECSLLPLGSPWWDWCWVLLLCGCHFPSLDN